MRRRGGVANRGDGPTLESRIGGRDVVKTPK